MIVWLLVAALLAALVVLGPSLRATRQSAPDARADHLRRLAELEAEIAAGEITPEDAPALRAELERTVIESIPQAPSATRPGNPRGLALIVVLAFLSSVPLYQHLGEPAVAEFALSHPELDVSDPANAIELLLDQVRKRTRSNPEDREAWMILARTQLQLGRYDEARDAAERAHALSPDDVESKLLLIDALSMQGGGIGHSARKLIDEVLQSEPANPTALILSGLAAEQDGRTDVALSRWRKALSGLEAEAAFRPQLEAMIARAQGPEETSPSGVSLAVSVELMPGLRDLAGPDNTVYVVARAADHSPPPLAVSRHSTSDLPLAITLTEAMAMVPGRSIADFEAIYIVARVSQSGQPMAAAGDLEGRTPVFDPREQLQLKIVIDKVLEQP